MPSPMTAPTPTPEDQIAAAELGASLARAHAEIAAMRAEAGVAYERGRLDGWRECAEHALGVVRRWPPAHAALIALTQNPPDDVAEPDR